MLSCFVFIIFHRIGEQQGLSYKKRGSDGFEIQTNFPGAQFKIENNLLVGKEPCAR